MQQPGSGQGETDQEDQSEGDAEQQHALTLACRQARGNRAHDDDVVARHGEIDEDHRSERCQPAGGEHICEAELHTTSGYWFIVAKKSSLVFESFILSSRNSIASTVPICMRIRRSTHIFES